MEAIILTCIQCEEDFEFSAHEQEKYRQKGFDAPLRCTQCRKKKGKKTGFSEEKKIKNKKKQYRLKFDEYEEYFG
jgi:hypothetical protein